VNARTARKRVIQDMYGDVENVESIRAQGRAATGHQQRSSGSMYRVRELKAAMKSNGRSQALIVLDVSIPGKCWRG